MTGSTDAPAAGPEAWSAPGPEAPDAERLGRLEEELLHASRELSRLHRELESQRERLRVERAEREDLLCVVSHELRTPLTVIGGYHRLLLNEEVGPLTPEQRKFLDESLKGCRRLDGFIANLLAATGRGAGAEVLEVGFVALAPLVEGVASMLSPQLEGRGLSLVIGLEPGLEVRADPSRVEQVLTNLLTNAAKYTPSGGTVRVEASGLEVPGHDWVRRWVEVWVSDDGPGVAPADRERVFEPYVRASSPSGAGGLGLGLAICRRLVAAHGGEIALGESPGGGCRVRFTLPAEAPQRPGARPGV